MSWHIFEGVESLYINDVRWYGFTTWQMFQYCFAFYLYNALEIVCSLTPNLFIIT